MSFSLQSPSPFCVMFGTQPSPSGFGSAGKALRGDDAAEEIARTVTLRAMAEAVDQIGAAIPRRRARSVRHERLVVHEQPFPDPDVAADIERKRHVVIAHLAGHRRKRFQIGKEIADVLDLGMRVGRVGKGRKVMRSGRRNPLASPRERIPPRSIARCRRPDRARYSARRTFRTATVSRARRRASGDRAGRARHGRRNIHPR